MERIERHAKSLTKKELRNLQRLEDDRNIEIAELEIAKRVLGDSSNWRDAALCSASSIDPELFDPPKKDEETLMRAKRICGRCAVNASCLATALNAQYPETELVWGGMSSEQRRVALRRNRRQRLNR